MSSQTHTVKVDASDTTRFTYYNVQEPGPFHGQGWQSIIGPSIDPDREGTIYNNTLQEAPLEDISVEFPFNGTKVSVFGTIKPPTAWYAPLPESAYSIIGWDWGNIPSMQPYRAPNVSQPVNNVNFWSSQEMPYGSYILTINVTNATSNMPYYLDYVAVELPGPDPSSTSSSAATSSSPATTSSSHTTSHSESATAVVASGKSSVPIGAIVGASIGGFVLVAAAVFALLYWYKRTRMAATYDYGSVAQQDPPPQVTPFVDPSQATMMAQAGDRGVLFVPGIPPSSPSTALRPQSPAILPSQKSLAMAAMRQNSVDVLSTGAGSSSVASGDRKDPVTFQNASRPHTPRPASEAGSSSAGPSIETAAHSPPSASDVGLISGGNSELPPAYTPS
ncbi:hypothetical protein PYCCODRAFT_1437821 [Trametes coccinea BRFM310]|uniref:Mid2 domain-containing protein n=1 Tax=Trametes coccinea (strain BRFM310) TaxID=1353009 RepID=A0A1Y2IFU2_TRAC3|nr:hypothetical protein PYCCODRAFT_1437821 [Trametes coccinea BRFM310]